MFLLGLGVCFTAKVEESEAFLRVVEVVKMERKGEKGVTMVSKQQPHLYKKSIDPPFFFEG